MHHRGNAVGMESNYEQFATGLLGQQPEDWVDRKRYLTPHSDFVAYLVLAHQTRIHNAIARANRNTKEALDYQERMQWLFGMASESLLASVKRRIEGPAKKLVNDLLMVDQAYFEGHVKGTFGFTDDSMNPGVGG